jgi:hypothetical protein
MNICNIIVVYDNEYMNEYSNIRSILDMNEYMNEYTVCYIQI